MFIKTVREIEEKIVFYHLFYFCNLCSPGWPQANGNSPASPSQKLGLQVSASSPYEIILVLVYNEVYARVFQINLYQLSNVISNITNLKWFLVYDTPYTYSLVF